MPLTAVSCGARASRRASLRVGSKLSIAIAVTPLGATGALAVFVGQGPGSLVHVIIDVNGYFQ